jgi:hypothetical protein
LFSPYFGRFPSRGISPSQLSQIAINREGKSPRGKKKTAQPAKRATSVARFAVVIGSREIQLSGR